MILRHVATFAWLRWRLLRNAFRPGGRRDAVERFSRAGAAALPIVAALLLAPAALLFGALGAGGGYVMGREGAASPMFLGAARVLLAVVTFAVLLAPLFRALPGAAPSSPRLLLLPIPRRVLHGLEVASSLTDPWIAVVAPALLLLPCGFAAAGAWPAAALSLAAGAALLGLLASLEALLASIAGLAFRNRRRGEIWSLAAAAILSVVGMVPLLLDTGMLRLGGATGTEGLVTGVARVVPSEWWARAVTFGANDRGASGFGWVALLAAAAVAVYALSSLAHRRLLEVPASGGTGHGAKRAVPAIPRFPGLSPGADAVAWAQVRSVLRTVSGKMIVFVNPVVFALLVVVLGRVFDDVPVGPRERGTILAGVGIMLSILSLHRVLLNQFAIDGGGLTLQVLAPLSDRDLVKGKAVGGAVLAATSFLIFVALCAAVAPWAGIARLLAVLLGGASTYLLFSPAAAFLSAVFPRPGDLSRVGSAGNPHTAAALLGLMLTPVLFAPAVALAAAGLLLGRSTALAVFLLAAWTLICAGVSIPLTSAVARVLRDRRENLALVAQGR